MNQCIYAGFTATLLSIACLSSKISAQADYCCYDSPLGSLIYDLEFRALYLLPTTSFLHYSIEEDALSCPNGVIHEIRPDYDWGFGITARLNFCECGSNLFISWDHFQSTDKDSKKVIDENILEPLFEVSSDASFYSRAKAKVEFDFDSLHFDYGLFVNVSECAEVNLYAGVNIAKVDQKLTAKFSNCNQRVGRSISVPSKFNGIGPEVGVDFAYTLCNHLQLTCGASASLLLGRHKNHTRNKSFTSDFSPNIQKTKCHSNTQCVPAFESKLGLAYDFTFCGCVFATFGVGYEAKVYINAIQSFDIGGGYARSFHKSLSNFSLSGPYLGLNIEYVW